MICKQCSLKKQSAFFTLKQLLVQEGLHVSHPVFHSTSYENADDILTTGFKARAGGPGNDAYKDNSVCFSRNLCFAEEDRFGRGEVIFVLDLNKLKNRFKSYTIDYHSRDIDSTKKLTPDEKQQQIFKKRKNPRTFEYEERISRSPKNIRDLNEPETVIPPKYIEAVIIKKGGGGARLWHKFGERKLFLSRTDKDKYNKIQNQTDTQDIYADLTHACMQNDFKEVEFALSGLLPNAGSKFTKEDRDYFLNLAVDYRSHEAVEVLLKHDFLNGTNGYPLRRASEKGLYSTVELLVEYGASTTAIDSIALKMACENNHPKNIMFLIKHGADINVENELPLYYAIVRKNAPLLKFLLENGADPIRLLEDTEEKINDGYTTDIYRVISEWAELKSLLIKHGVPPGMLLPPGLRYNGAG